MIKLLKISGFLGLATMMLVGLYMGMQLESGSGDALWLVPGHAHLGVLSILAIVTGFAIDAFGVVGQIRQAVTGTYLLGQWGLPLAVWGVAYTENPIIGMSIMLWGTLLVVSMLLMAYQADTVDHEGRDRIAASAPADD
ncbi:hypothetical protein [Haloarchaeobius sp. DFWS5]|uniref:hypothetical protein n=1 Tax=Haloarchaeobius sp. DFWS5 TaxID=3446114 RepID=UPI003EBB4B02